jgi:hypothetical protein
VSIAGGDWEEAVESVGITRLPCRYGGVRPYFLCPGVVNGKACGRRVSKLYGPGRYFLCRHCYRLAYSSQSEGAFDRALRRTNTIRKKLGGDPGLASPFPERPKGMWRRTYEQLQEQVAEIEIEVEDAMDARLERVEQRFNQSSRRKFWT